MITVGELIERLLKESNGDEDMPVLYICNNIIGTPNIVGSTSFFTDGRFRNVIIIEDSSLRPFEEG